jgi:hypothetical protein
VARYDDDNDKKVDDSNKEYVMATGVVSSARHGR